MHSSKMCEYEAGRGISKPIGVLFGTPIYERALKICWHISSYKVQIVVLSELLRLQQKHQLPSAVSVKDMCDLLVEESKTSLRTQLWEDVMEDMEEEAKPLLQLVWEVINSLKMRDIEFEARMLLHYTDVPPNSDYPRITSKAQEYAKTLTERLQKPTIFRLLGPRQVVLEVVPKVLQGIWLPPPDTFVNMPSQQLSTMAVRVTKAVLDRVSADLSTMEHRGHFCCVTIDVVILSVLRKIKQNYSLDVSKERLECFAGPLLQNIVDTAAGEICELFEPRPVKNIAEETSPSADEELGLEEDSVGRDVSPVITPPPAPLSSTAEAPAQDVLEEQPAPKKAKKESRGFRRFFGQLRKNVCRCFWPGVNKEA